MAYLFPEVETEKIAVSDHLVVYRAISGEEKMTPESAEEMLQTLEPAWDKLKEVYGGGSVPNIQKSNRVVILATDILDDYNGVTSHGYISGFFSKRDLFSNDFTEGLIENPSIISDDQYGNLDEIESSLNLRGISNENHIVYLDLSPFYDGTAFGGNAPEGKSKANEAVLHELSHLFTYYKRIVEKRVANHETWIAEGIAEQAPAFLAGLYETQEERLYQYNDPNNQAYLIDASSTLADIDSSGNRILGLLQSNLFFNYLRHRSGSDTGAGSLLAAFVEADDNGITGINDTLSAETGKNFGELFRDWVVSTWIGTSGRSITSITDNGGTSLDIGDGTSPSLLYDLSYRGVNILPHGETGLAFGDSSLPITDDSIRELPPASYAFFSYTVTGSETSYIPHDEGMEEGLTIVLAHLNENGTEATLSYYNTTSPYPLIHSAPETGFILLLSTAIPRGKIYPRDFFRGTTVTLPHGLARDLTAGRSPVGLIPEGTTAIFTAPPEST